MKSTKKSFVSLAVEAVQGCRSSVLCPSCELISYCSAACLEDDRSDHRLECAIMEDLSQLPDITRITARLLLKLEEEGEVGWVDLASKVLPVERHQPVLPPSPLCDNTAD